MSIGRGIILSDTIPRQNRLLKSKGGIHIQTIGVQKNELEISLQNPVFIYIKKIGPMAVFPNRVESDKENGVRSNMFELRKMF